MLETEDAPIFPEVWKQIESKIAGLPLVANNKAFDESCLKAVFHIYWMDYPDSVLLYMRRFVPSLATRQPHH